MIILAVSVEMMTPKSVEAASIPSNAIYSGVILQV
jgi:hypothetical protein